MNIPRFVVSVAAACSLAACALPEASNSEHSAAADPGDVVTGSRIPHRGSGSSTVKVEGRETIEDAKSQMPQVPLSTGR